MTTRRTIYGIVSCAGVVLAIILFTSVTPADVVLTPKEQFGKELFFDRISDPDSQSCASCHAPAVGFTGPIPGINKHGAVYRGAVPTRFGNRKPPTSAYATLSPVFHFDEDEEEFTNGTY